MLETERVATIDFT
jgi:hypothetical protein